MVVPEPQPAAAEPFARRELETPRRQARPLPVAQDSELSPEAPGAPVRVVRRRCSGKGPAVRLDGGASPPPVAAGGSPPPGPPPDPPAAQNVAEAGDFDDEREVDGIAGHKRHMAFYQAYGRWVKRKVDECGDDEREHQLIRVRLNLRGKTLEARLALVQRFAADGTRSQTTETMITWLKERIEQHAQSGKNRFLEQKTALLTWQGDWGLLEDMEVNAEPFAGEDEEIKLEAIDAVVVRLRADGRVTALWDAFKGQVQRWAEQLHISETGMALELCTQTLASQRQVRVHLHLFLRSMARLIVISADTFRFKDTVPFKSTGQGTSAGLLTPAATAACTTCRRRRSARSTQEGATRPSATTSCMVSGS